MHFCAAIRTLDNFREIPRSLATGTMEKVYEKAGAEIMHLLNAGYSVTGVPDSTPHGAQWIARHESEETLTLSVWVCSCESGEFQKNVQG